MKVKPLDDRVLVEVAVEEEKTASGLIIPDTAKEKPRMGKVVAVGTDKELQEIIKVGDNILFAKYGGEDITVGTDEFKIVQRGDILAVIED